MKIDRINEKKTHAKQIFFCPSIFLLTFAFSGRMVFYYSHQGENRFLVHAGLENTSKPWDTSFHLHSRAPTILLTTLLNYFIFKIHVNVWWHLVFLVFVFLLFVQCVQGRLVKFQLQYYMYASWCYLCSTPSRVFHCH